MVGRKDKEGMRPDLSWVWTGCVTVRRESLKEVVLSLLVDGTPIATSLSTLKEES